MSAPKTTNSKAKEHLQEAYENYCRYERFLDEPENRNWAVVLLFYSAIHLVTAYAADKHPHTNFNSHQDRKTYIRTHLRVINNNYNKLEVVSKEARYMLVRYNRGRTVRLHDEFFSKIRIELRTLGFEWEVPSSPPVEATGETSDQ